MEEIEYEKYKFIILKLAHQYKKNKLVEFEDLVGIGNLAFVIASQKYNVNKKVKFSTFLYRCVENALLNTVKAKQFYYTKKENFIFVNKKTIRENVGIDNLEDDKNHYRVMIWARGLSKESQFVLNLIWKTPGKIGKNVTKTTIKKYLISQGWEHPMVYSCYNEIKRGLKDI